jgi:hypothetical protein
MRSEYNGLLDGLEAHVDFLAAHLSVHDVISDLYQESERRKGCQSAALAKEFRSSVQSVYLDRAFATPLITHTSCCTTLLICDFAIPAPDPTVLP